MPVSRRLFIEKSAAIVTGLSLGPSPANAPAGAEVELTYDADVPQLVFAAAEIRNGAAAARTSPHSAVIELRMNPADLKPQCYRIERAARRIRVVGGDANGAMYGGLDVAEAVRLGALERLPSRAHAPFIPRRGIKFNIPLDARTPSYSDAGDSAQKNIPEMWSLEFWHEFLDEMARDRYNVLTLWNLHPFPSMVRVPEYPGVALSDVMRTTAEFDPRAIGGTGINMVGPALLAEMETVKHLTIEEKTAFWREVMQYAHDRGIGVYLFTWNIFVWGAEGKYGITAQQDNPKTIDYFRKSVRATLLAYPLLQGFGITAGEHMQNLKGELTNEKWLWKTYGEGIADVKRLQPDRDIRLIHRFHQTSFGDIAAEWKDFPGAFEFSYKYSVAHMYSSPTPPFARPTLESLPAGQRTWLTVRNDDIYNFRWGDPEYARTYIQAMPGEDKLAGFYMGPDGYTWGREFVSTEPDTPRQLVITKQSYSFLLWGRLSYDPTLPDSLFERILAARFPEVAGAKLFAAYASASKIIPQITRFFWGGTGNDFEWFPEACVHRPAGSAGFYTVVDFIIGHAMPGTGILDIRAFTSKKASDEKIAGTTPLLVAEALNASADTTVRLLDDMRARNRAIKDKELRLTLGDLAAVAHLGHYYSEKILGATDLALFMGSGDLQQQESAVKHLEAALDHWKRYATVTHGQYRPQLLTRIGYVDLHALTASVRQDIEIAKAMKQQAAGSVTT